MLQENSVEGTPKPHICCVKDLNNRGSGKSHSVHEYFFPVDERQMGGILCPHSSLYNYPISVRRNKSGPQNEQNTRLKHREFGSYWKFFLSYVLYVLSLAVVATICDKLHIGVTKITSEL